MGCNVGFVSGDSAAPRSRRRWWNLASDLEADSAEPALKSLASCCAYRSRFGKHCGPPLSTPLVEIAFILQGGFCGTRLEAIGKFLFFSDWFREILRWKLTRRDSSVGSADRMLRHWIKLSRRHVDATPGQLKLTRRGSSIGFADQIILTLLQTL